MTNPAPKAPLVRLSGLAGLAVLLMHLVVAGLFWRMQVWGDRQAAVPAQQPLVVRLWWTSAQPQLATELARTERPRARLLAPQEKPRAITPQAMADPSAAAVDRASQAPASAGMAPLSEPEPTPSVPLNLALPRAASAPWRQRNPALDDPRSNIAKLSMEQKLASAMGGDGTWVTERVDLNTIRYRRGNECIQLTRSRAGQLDLGGAAFRDSWLAGSC